MIRTHLLLIGVIALIVVVSIAIKVAVSAAIYKGQDAYYKAQERKQEENIQISELIGYQTDLIKNAETNTRVATSDPAYRFCDYCGNKMSYYAQFCPKCGGKIMEL